MTYKPKTGARKGQAPSITVPATLTQVTYLNIPLVDYLRERGYERMTFNIDEVSKEITVRKAREGEKGYKILSTGRRGFGVSPKLAKFLPAGRYELTDKRRMVFQRA